MSDQRAARRTAIQRTAIQETVSATVAFEPKPEGGFKVASSKLTVRGSVSGIDAAGFSQAAEAAKDGCPISGALKGNVELSVEATLAS